MSLGAYLKEMNEGGEVTVNGHTYVCVERKECCCPIEDRYYEGLRDEMLCSVCKICFTYHCDEIKY